MIARIWEREGY